MNAEQITDKIESLEEMIERLFNSVKNENSRMLLEAIFHLISLVKNVEYGTASRAYYKQKLRYANEIINRVLKKVG